jgi:hypothetical protein
MLLRHRFRNKMRTLMKMKMKPGVVFARARPGRGCPAGGGTMLPLSEFLT